MVMISQKRPKMIQKLFGDVAVLRWPVEGTADEVKRDHVHGFAAGFGCRGAGSVLLEVIEEVGGHGCKWLMTVMLNLWASDSV